jgi:hypothetical protein
MTTGGFVEALSSNSPVYAEINDVAKGMSGALCPWDVKSDHRTHAGGEGGFVATSGRMRERTTDGRFLRHLKGGNKRGIVQKSHEFIVVLPLSLARPR